MPRNNKKDKIGSVKNDPLYTSDDFRMYCFKVMPCSRHYTHDWTECPFAHPGEKATRRDPRLFTYVGIDCPHIKGESNKCPRGDMCPFAHNVFECWLHPSRYRTQMCNEPATCRRKICFFAHSREEMREPTPVSKNVDIGLKTGPRRVPSTTSERTSPSPRLHFDAKQHLDVKAAATKNRASFDVARPSPPVDLPPRPSLDGSSKRPGRSSNPMNQKISPRMDQPHPQLLSVIAMLQQQQEQQQQMQMKSDSFDLAAALNQLSMCGNQQPCVRGPCIPPSLNMSNGHSEQLNELLRLHLQQQSLNAADTLAMNPAPGFRFNPSAGINYNLASMSNPLLLQQQLQQLQNQQGLSAAGWRSSLDSTLSNGSGRIPARVSFDGVTSTAPHILQQSFYLNLPTLQQGLLNGMGADLSPNLPVTEQQRTSTDSSVADSFGCFSGEAIALQSLKQAHGQAVGFPNQPSATEDFISFNQGVESFTRANTTTSMNATAPYQS